MQACQNHYTHKCNRPQAGFTLLEIMVVLVLIGLTAASVIPNLNAGDSQKAVEKTARRFSALVQIAHETALITGQNLGVKLTREGYEFKVWQQGQWQPMAGDRLLKPVNLDENIGIRLHPGESVWAEVLKLESDSSPSSLTDEDIEKKKEPDIFIWSSGDLTPASIDFSSRRKGSQTYTVILKESGEITLNDDRGKVRS